MGFLKGSMKHLQIHIFIIFRVHKLIPNCQFLVSSILDLASLLEACGHDNNIVFVLSYKADKPPIKDLTLHTI